MYYLLFVLIALALAQFPPERSDYKTVRSRFHDGVSISYKEPGICETTPGVRSYSGYVHLPPGSLTEHGELQDYPINTFFWFFEARKNPQTAPLSIWLNGGPGGSSMFGALMENGPCFVGNDSNSTYLNPWSWNNEVNMLYIDQPNQVGFSYGTLHNITQNLLPDLSSPGFASPSWELRNFTEGVPEQNNTFLVGTWPSMNKTHTANSTHHSAIALWHFAQTWFSEFPAYQPEGNRISLWAESYGGTYGPSISRFFQHQNEKIAKGELRGSGLMYLFFDTLGIVNGLIDSLVQSRSYADFAYKNTYGIEAINATAYETAISMLERPGGIEETIRECRRLARDADPDNVGDTKKVNQVCSRAETLTFEYLNGPYLYKTKYGWFDITHPSRDPFPIEYMTGYLNQHWVQKALGVPVNFTAASDSVSSAFEKEGDMARGQHLEELAYMLDHGTKVVLLYGDRDYACNWLGGEKASLAIPYSRQDDFRKAGYAPLATNPFYRGGQTRQYGNLSFSRVYQSGHMIPTYQPETAYRIFMRAMFNKDIATGRQTLSDELQTHGPNTTWRHLNDVLPPQDPVCYIRGGLSMTCSDEQFAWLRDGTAVVKDWIVVGRETSKDDSHATLAATVSGAQLPLVQEL